MKTFRIRGFFLRSNARSSVFRTIVLFSAIFSFFLFAQRFSYAPDGSLPATPQTVVAGAVSSLSTNISRAPLNVADIIGSPPPLQPEETDNVPAWVPPVVSAYLPNRDTNVGIGIWYPAGSRNF